jgi:hypothetical protein
MKANELRIGNWYDHNGIPTQVTPNTIEEVWEAERIWCKAIPLTEEWLLKFGFDKLPNCWDNDIFHLSEWDNYPMNWCVVMNKNNAVLILKLKYVHQLQNLYFALTGEELIITEVTNE